VFTVYINGIASSLQITIPQGSKSAISIASLPVNAGDDVSLNVNASAGDGDINVNGTIYITA
jgi:hypothetical protein